MYVWSLCKAQKIILGNSWNVRSRKKFTILKIYIEDTYFLLNKYDLILRLGLTVIIGSVCMQS